MDFQTYLSTLFKENHFIKNGTAYTEDNLPVYNVCVYGIPSTVTQAEVSNYFSEFGVVKAINWYTNENQMNRQFAYICFEKSSSATRALEHDSHFLGSNRIEAKACNSWLQPGGAETLGYRYDDTKPTLLQLNDDCLDYICQKLPLSDQVRFARACRRFQSIFQMRYRLQWKHFQTGQFNCPMTLWEERLFIEIAGPHIETVIVGGLIAEEVFNVMVEYLKNVKRLDLCDGKIARADFRMYAVDELILQNYHILSLASLTSLEHLNLSNNTQLTGKYLNQLSGIKELVLTGCCNIEACHLKAIFKSLHELKTLNIQKLRIDETVYHEMVQHCKVLEVLKITWHDNCQCEAVALLPSLKQLTVELFSEDNETAHLFAALAEHKFSQLEYLAIQPNRTWNITHNDAAMISRLVQLKQLVFTELAGVSDESLQLFGELVNLEELETGKSNLMTNSGLLSVLSKCLKLKRILVLHSLNITDAFVLQAIEVVGKRQILPEEPVLLQFPVGSTRIRKSILNNPKYLDATTSLIKVSFEDKMDDAERLLKNLLNF